MILLIENYVLVVICNASATLQLIIELTNEGIVDLDQTEVKVSIKLIEEIKQYFFVDFEKKLDFVESSHINILKILHEFHDTIVS